MIQKALSNDGIAIAALLIVGIVCVLLLCWSFRPTMDGYEWQEELYTVQEGDSLWSIAGRYCPDGVDRGEWVDEIQALNDLRSSIIHPGDDLIVLVAIGKE